MKDWQHIQRMFHTALELKTEERSAYLAGECAGDEQMLQEVESLIAASEKPDDLLERLALSLGLQVLSLSDSMDETLTDQLIGSFKILSVLGSGGMGKVYLAEDTQLGRKIAMKFLSTRLNDNQWAKRQFVKEAQAIAMLDHPNICAIHGFEETDGHSFIVMQYIEGQRLDDLVQGGVLKPKEVIGLSIQIANALSEAHVHGIIHRDIKPPNIMVTANGQAKVLDFGLAKLVQQQSILSADEHSSHSLQLGFIPGTVAYMSPEQLRGERLDCQTDIFSFGTVLYEMITGKNPFARDNKAETISAILTSQPPSLKNNSLQIPRELIRIVQKCLEKEKDKRYQSANELLLDLGNLQKIVDGSGQRRRLLSVRSAAAATLLLLMLVVAAFIYNYLTRPRSLAILPIANETGDATLDYLSYGLTDNIINRLTGLSKLRVRAFSTVAGYKGQPIDPLKIGRDLNVDAIVIGKITGTKDSPNLQTVMISTADGSQLWGDSYSLGLQDIFTAEAEVARQVTSRLELWSGSDEDRLQAMHRPPPDAYNQYMLGRFYWRYRKNPTDINKAIESFNEAIRLDPRYAKAWAGLADCYLLLNMVSFGHMNTKEAMLKAEENARKALTFDDNLPDAHASLGAVHLRYYWNWQDAEREFNRAITLDPDYAQAHVWYSNLLTITGRHQEAILQSEISRKLDPFSPSATINYCRALYYARQYDQAASCFDVIAKEQPGNPLGQYAHGLILLQKGMYEEASAKFQTLYEVDKTLAGAVLGYTYGVAGRKADALKVLSDMQELGKQKYLPPQEFAIIYLGLGDMDNAFVWFKKAADEHFAPFAFLAVDPMLDNLHSDPRFIELAQHLNLPISHPSP